MAIFSVLSYGFSEDYFEISKNLDIFSTLFRELSMYYVDDADPGKLMKKGIDSMLESLDPYTNYIPESEIEDYRFMTTGQYGGIGAGIRQREDYVVITDPYEGYPAQKADIRAGDIILEVDGKSAKGKKSDEMSKILKGSAKTSVRLLIKREGESAPIEKVVTREEIKIKSVPYSGMVSPGTGYIKLNQFTESAGKDVKDAFMELKKNPDLKYIILDLRGNPGGLLNEAVNIANIFIGKGQQIVSTKGKIKESDKIYRALDPAVDTQIPIAVLVNSGLASASEIVSGAIQDLDRGIVIGQRTYGKGLVQTTRPLSYNSQLKVTTAKYYTPSGRCIQALDYTHRNEDGSVGKIPDSLITEFKTQAGRIVYDGGGVAPDVPVEAPGFSNIATTLLAKFLIFDFATAYKQGHPSIAPARDFRLADSEFDEFTRFIATKDYDYVSKSEKILNELKENAEKEKAFEDIKGEFEMLKNRLANNKKSDLIRFKAEVMQLLNEEIVSRYYFQKGKIELGLARDEEVQKAIEILRDQKKYASILSTGFKIPDAKGTQTKN
jgi:carboxyl-terminal processing protease